MESWFVRSLMKRVGDGPIGMLSAPELIRIRNALAQTFDRTSLEELASIAFDNNLADILGMVR
jgi:hypothetical protein